MLFHRTRESGEGLLGVVDGEETNDLKFLLAGGRGDLNFVADLAVEQRAADRRGGGDEAFFGVGFLAADQLVFDFGFTLDIEDDDAGAEAGAVLGNIGEVEHAEVAEAFFQVADSRVDEALAFLGEFVLGVFGKIAVGAGDGNFLGKLDVELMLQVVNFLLDLLLDLREWIGHWNSLKKIRGGGIV